MIRTQMASDWMYMKYCGSKRDVGFKTGIFFNMSINFVLEK